MAYGDNRNQVASDTFDTTISGSWANGDGDWTTCAWATGGHIQMTTGGGNDAAIRRNNETFDDDQYSRTTVQTHGASNRWISAAVRMQSGTDESGYVGWVQSQNDRYQLDEYNSSFGFTTLGTLSDPGTEIPHSSGDIITCEAEGTTIRLGSDASGSDLQKISSTDNTLTSGEPGITLWSGGGQEGESQATAWSAGDIGAGAADYTEVMQNLSPDHLWPLAANSNDLSSPAADGTDTSITYTGGALCEDVANSAGTNDVGDRVSFGSVASIGNSAQTAHFVALWFEVDSFQPPPKRIYGEGDEAPTFQIVFGYGNNVMFEVVDLSTSPETRIQIYGPPLAPGRTYHLAAGFWGTGLSPGGVARFWVDGVEQTNASPTDRATQNTTLAARGVAELADPAGVVGVGGAVVILNAPTNGEYNMLASWEGNAAAALDTSDVRGDMFEKGALPTVTISADTQSNMQDALDALASPEGSNYNAPDAPLAIRVEEPGSPASSPAGSLTLTATNVTFDSKASIHVQWMGTGTLTWRNDINSNATIFSTPNGGNVVVENETSLTIVGLDIDTEVRVYVAGTTNEIAGIEDIASPQTFQANVFADLVDIQLVSIDNEIQRLENIDTSEDVTLQVTQFFDRNYSNP